MTSKGHLKTTFSHTGSCNLRHVDDPKCGGSTAVRLAKFVTTDSGNKRKIKTPFLSTCKCETVVTINI